MHVHAASSAASCNETLLSGHSRHDSSATALYVPDRHAAQVAPSDKYPALQRHALAPVASVLFEFGGKLEQVVVEVPEKVRGTVDAGKGGRCKNICDCSTFCVSIGTFVLVNVFARRSCCASSGPSACSGCAQTHRHSQGSHHVHQAKKNRR